VSLEGEAVPDDRDDDRLFEQPFSRRELFRKAGLAGLALPPAAALLAACGKAAPVTSIGGSTPSGPNASSNPYGTGGIAGAPYPLARPDHPVTWNILADNPAVKDGLSPESGPLKVFGYGDYIYKKVLNAFEKKYNTKVQWTAFTTPEEMVSKLQTGATQFDVIVTVTLENVGKLIAGKLIQPINHNYLPNLTNIWQTLQSPFYDKESRYTVPYTVYTTGIGVYTPLVPEDVANMPNPYDVLWDPKFKGKAYLLNGARDAISAALLRRGIKDVNTTDATVLNQAKQDLLQGSQAMNWKFDHTDYNELGQFAVHNTWSGQVAYYQYYLPQGVKIDQFLYVWPPKTPSKKPGLISNDVFAIPKTAKNPVLAHSLIDFVLQQDNAISNYGYEGYQPPLNFIQPDQIVSQGLVPENLKNIVITEQDFPLGVTELEITPAANQMWESIYQQVTGGA
jgi:spermidine/putrescine transport system substrate-binding protein